MLARRLFLTATRLSRQTQNQATRTCSFVGSNHEAGSITSHIEDKIQQNKVVVFSKSHCPFCTKAKRVFEEMLEEKKLTPADYEVMEIEDNPHCDLIQDHLHKLTGAKTVPRVFINQQCVGGGDDVAAAYNSGKLMKLLTES
ncbi:uncharacterized protein LOC143281872 [Babylonia areolata]|uniref:uncharacterized protein LOC143281872 n=1 Tax=Babylonia areolata TaxID=304850 RepID=UPI003FD5582D